MFTSLVIFGVIMFAITFISVKATDALRPVESAPYQKNARNISDFPSEIEFYRAIRNTHIS